MYKSLFFLSIFFIVILDFYRAFAIQTKAPRAIPAYDSSETYYFQVSEELITKVHSYIMFSRGFDNYTYEDTLHWVEELAKERLSQMEDSFPYFLSGYDFQERPVWIMEVGKYNITAIGQDEEHEWMEKLKKYIYQGGIRVIKSLLKRGKGGKAIGNATFLIDLDGLDVAQVVHSPITRFILNLLEMHTHVVNKILGQLIVINANYIYRMALATTLPMVGGEFFNRMRIFGNCKAHWIPILRSLIPLESVPPWYGGHDDFKPIEV